MMTRQELSEFTNNYYRRPGTRHRLGEALRCMATIFAEGSGEEAHARSLCLYFFARVARLDSTVLPLYEQLLAEEDTDLSSLASTEVRRFVETLLWLGRDDRTGDPPEDLPEYFPLNFDVLERPARNRADLDYLWIEFTVTGSQGPVLKVIEVLRWPDLIRSKLEDWLQIPGKGLLDRWHRRRVLRRLERVAGVRCDPQRQTILTPGDLDCLCSIGPQADRGYAARFPLIQAALPFQLSEAELNHIFTKGAARWSTLSFVPHHPVVAEVWRSKMPEGGPEGLASVTPSPQGTSGQSLTYRAAVALGLTIGFYGLALGTAGVLVFIPLSEWQHGRWIPVQLAVFLLAISALILWAIAPRPGRFIPPGPRLLEADQPRLFSELRSVAAALDQPLPDDVYLAPDVTASVTQRGGALGIGSRWVMGLGLPLLAILTVSQLRAVLAHEFGHYHAGDTKLGPWVYKTRAAIGRTIQTLRWSMFQYPFLWYGRMFLRVTHAVSRAQEFAADRLAARMVGARPVIAALQGIDGAVAPFQQYVHAEVLPILSTGLRPPVSEGFRRFLSSGAVRKSGQDLLRMELASQTHDPYDTHPPLRERIDALRDLPPGDSQAVDPPALSLIDHLLDLEAELVAVVMRNEQMAAFPLVAWDEITSRAWVRIWEAQCRSRQDVLRGLTLSALPDATRDLVSVGQRLASRSLPDAEAASLAFITLGSALALTLRSHGWTLDAAPGAEVTARKGDAVLAPFAILTRLAQGELSADEWRKECGTLGIENLDLGSAAPDWKWTASAPTQREDPATAALRRGDYTAALLEWLPRARQGEADSQYHIGMMYQSGMGVPRDYAEALRWLRRAAAQGHTDAEYLLGLACAQGLGVQQDDRAAAAWWRKAAEKGDAPAQYNLGLMYLDGRGVSRDPVQAYVWFERAASGYQDITVSGLDSGKYQDDAIRMCNTVRKMMTASQLAEAERLARGKRQNGNK